jgi:ribosome-associated protein
MRDFNEILKEVSYKTSRSSGAGGQHVNKTESRVEVIFNIEASSFFFQDEKELLQEKLIHLLDKEGNIHVTSQKNRSQHQNREDAEKKLIALLKRGLRKAKKRKPTKIPKAAKEKRLKIKRIKSDIKQNRKKPKW